MLVCPDTAWHLATGEEIVSKWVIPYSDPWSYTTGDYPWLNISWLWDCLVYLLYKASGSLSLPLAVNILLNSLTVALVIYNSWRIKASLIGHIPAYILTVTAFSDALLLRPQQMSHLLYALLLMLLLNIDKSGTGILNFSIRTYLVFCLKLFLLFALWVNLHGAFLIGLLTIFIWAGDRLITDLKSRDKPTKNIFLVTLCAILVLPATTINPLGVHVYEGAKRTLAGPLQKYILEWQPIFFPPLALNKLLYLTIAAAAILVFFRCSKLSRTERLLTAILLIASVKSQRHLPFLIIVAYPACVLLFEQLLTPLFWRPSNLGGHSKPPEVTEVSDKALKNVKILATLSTSLLLVIGQFQILPAPMPTNIPLSEFSYIIKHEQNRRWFNYYDDGGYFIYFSRGKISCFLDSRAETAFPPQVVQDYLTAYFMKPGWENVFARYAIDGVILPRSHKLLLQLKNTKNWQAVFTGDERVVMVQTLHSSAQGF